MPEKHTYHLIYDKMIKTQSNNPDNAAIFFKIELELLALSVQPLIHNGW